MAARHSKMGAAKLGAVVTRIGPTECQAQCRALEETHVISSVLSLFDPLEHWTHKSYCRDRVGGCGQECSE